MSHFSISEYFKLLDNGQRQCLHCENKTCKTTDDEVLRNHILTKHPAIINTPPVPPSRPQLDSQLNLMESQVGSPTAGSLFDSSGDPQIGTSSRAVRQPTIPMPVLPELPNLEQFLEDNGLGKYYENFTAENCKDIDVSELLDCNNDELTEFASLGKLMPLDVFRFKKGVRQLKESRNPQASAEGSTEEEHAPKRKLEEDKLDDILEQLKAIREDKKTTISISRITQKHLTALLKELGLSRRTVEFDMASTTKRVSSFVWMDKKEDAHAQEYLTWLEGCINLPSGVNFYITSNKANLLSTTIASSQFNITGTLDVAIVDRKYVRSRNTAGGIRVGLELKKTVEESNVMQAITELIAASIYSEYPVVMVLTDLGEDWQFFWLERGCVVDCVFDLKESITLLETIVQQPRPPVGQSISGAPYLQRCNFRTAISQARESDDAIPEDTEVEGLERLLQRPKVDIMSMLPEDDVADMRDVFDVMTPKEIREWQLRRVLDFAMQTPAMQSSMKAEDWRSIYA